MKVLTENDVFICNCSPTTFCAKEPIKKIFSNSCILTKKAFLTCMTPASCSKLQGGSCFCAKLSGNWIKASNKLTINSVPALVKESYIMCPIGGKISVHFPREIKIEIKRPLSVEIPSAAAIVLSPAAAAIPSSKTPKQVEEIKSDKMKLSHHILKSSEVTNNYKNTEESSEKKEIGRNIVSEVKKKSQKVPNFPYALCDYENCREWKECEYLKAAYTAESIKNLSSKLGENYKSKYPEKYSAYEEETKQLNAESTEGNWSTAKHHIISGKQIFAVHPYLVKLANYYKYDINNAENCILLPTTHSFEGKEGIYKQANGYIAMNYMKQQWHVGSHSYIMDEEIIRNINNYLEKSSNNNIVFYKNYVEAVEHEMNIMEAKYKKISCRKKDYLIKQKKFIENMNSISVKVGQKLLDFKNGVKNSFPFYVSKEAIYYAFDIPNRKKFIIIYKKQHKKSKLDVIVAVKMVVTRYKKDNYKILFTNDDEYIISDDAGFIRFSENVRYFVYLTEDNPIPWNIDNSREYVLHDTFLYDSIDDYCKANEQKLISFIEGRENGEMYYEPIAKIVKQRLSEI